MNRTQLSLLAMVALIVAPMTLQAATKTVPRINKVTYADKLSSEPVLVQTIRLDGITADAAKDAVERAATKRTWEVETLETGDIHATLVHRSHDSTLTFKVMDGVVEVWSVSYQIDKKTQERKKRDEPEGWIRNLHKDILILLGLLEK